MDSTYRQITQLELGVITDIGDNSRPGTIKTVRGSRTSPETLEFNFSDRRRVCSLGNLMDPNNPRKHERFFRQNDSSLIWMPVPDPVYRSTDLPGDRFVVFERKTAPVPELKNWSGRRPDTQVVASPWASYQDSLYVLTWANSVNYVIRDKLGRVVWSGLYSQQTGCRIDNPDSVFPSSPFACSVIEWELSGMLVEVDSKRKRFSELFNATVINADSEEQKVTTGRRAM